MPRDKTGPWSKPDMLTEGPTGNANNYGDIKPWCSDCASCTAKLCGRAEYIPVEFAKDREIQTPTLPTTQHIVGNYLSDVPRDICIVNAGLHDMEISKGAMQSEQYVMNVDSYMKLIRPGCKQIVWIHTSSVKGVEKYIHLQNNPKISKWNKAVDKMLIQKHRHVFIIDVFEFSKQSHVDNVHLNGKYYSMLAGFIQSCIEQNTTPTPI